MHLYKLLIKKYLIKNKYITRKENFRFTSIKKDDQYYLGHPSLYNRIFLH